MKAEIGDDAFDTADTDDQTGLAQFLGDDGWGGIRIEKAVADDLPDDFAGTAVIALGSAFLVAQGRRPTLQESVAELEVTLLAEAEVVRGLERTTIMALTLDEHGELACDVISRRDRKFASGADDLESLTIELQHKSLLCQGEMCVQLHRKLEERPPKSNEMWRYFRH